MLSVELEERSEGDRGEVQSASRKWSGGEASLLAVEEVSDEDGEYKDGSEVIELIEQRLIADTTL